MDKRPVRIAFLVDPTTATAWELDAIVAYNHSKWGGRFNPIICVDGNTISDTWWQFLREVDPDVIKSLIPLHDSQIIRIQEHLSPLSLEVPTEREMSLKKNGSGSVGIYHEALTILPTADALKEISRSVFEKPKLAIFTVHVGSDELVKRFIDRNFGAYMKTLQVDRALEKIETRAYQVSDRKSLGDALGALAREYGVAYSVQFSALPNTSRDVEYDAHGETFTVCVGDSVLDEICSWNRTLSIPVWRRIDLAHVWLPTELAEDSVLESGLRAWLKSRAGEKIHFMSRSIDETRLKSISDRLTRGSYLRVTHATSTEPLTPKYVPRLPYPDLRAQLDEYRLLSPQDHITLNEPKVPDHGTTGDHWMADVYVEFQPEAYPNIQGMTFWWQFPPRNILASYMFNGFARIRRDGFPSVLMRRGSPSLAIREVGSPGVFHGLIADKERPVLKHDPRARFAQRPFESIRRSDKGRYLSGFLDVFGGLSSAYMILQERYWRQMLNVLSRQDPSADGMRLEAIKNKLKKQIERSGSDFYHTTEGQQWLSSLVLNQAKEQRGPDQELPFKYFIEEARRETEALNAGRQGQQFTFREEEVRDAVSRLTDMNVLLIGIRSQCLLCGSANWHHIDEAHQTLTCKGCRYAYPMRPEEDWHYKLNALVKAGCANHYLIPVVLVLGQLLFECRSSFIFSTSLELRETRDGKPFGDIDVVCIQDGKFIIGEVKNSVNGFSSAEFDKMEEIAKRTRPNVLLFSSLDPQPSPFVVRSIETVKNRLAPLEIDVKWYQLHTQIFEPSPVR